MEKDDKDNLSEVIQEALETSDFWEVDNDKVVGEYVLRPKVKPIDLEFLSSLELEDQIQFLADNFNSLVRDWNEGN